MKAYLNSLALLVALTASSCSEEASDVTLQPTCGAQKLVRQDAQAIGRVWFDKQQQLYTIRTEAGRPLPAAAVGFICGDLPAAFRKDSLLVGFTGTYREFDKGSAPAGAPEHYYLSLSFIEAVKDE